ncbi:hypothetical protein V6281_24695, partial [Enterobacter asburiae]
KPKKKLRSKKEKALLLKEISSMENPFLRLMIYNNQMQEELIKKNYLKYKMKTQNVAIIKNKMKKSVKLSRHCLAVIERNAIDLIDQDKLWEKWLLCINKLTYIINKK